MSVCRAPPEAIRVRGGVGGGAAEGVFLRFFETCFKISGRTKRRWEIADVRPAGRNARRAGSFFEIGGEIGGCFAQRALGQFGFDFVAQLEKNGRGLQKPRKPGKHV